MQLVASLVTLDDIRQAQARIRGIAVRTPLLRYPAADGELYLKAECFQPIGSFKLRGAYNKIATLSEAERRRGVIAHSSGNHAQGVAYAARAIGVKATIVVPNDIPKIKLAATKSYGADVVMVGPASAERIAAAEKLAAEHGWVPVPPYNDEKIIAGQGTIGLELLEDLSDLDLVLAPVSGGNVAPEMLNAILAEKS